MIFLVVVDIFALIQQKICLNQNIYQLQMIVAESFTSTQFQDAHQTDCCLIEINQSHDCFEISREKK